VNDPLRKRYGFIRKELFDWCDSSFLNSSLSLGMRVKKSFRTWKRGGLIDRCGRG